jgi:hypothetical protein
MNRLARLVLTSVVCLGFMLLDAPLRAGSVRVNAVLLDGSPRTDATVVVLNGVTTDGRLVRAPAVLTPLGGGSFDIVVADPNISAIAIRATARGSTARLENIRVVGPVTQSIDVVLPLEPPTAPGCQPQYVQHYHPAAHRHGWFRHPLFKRR